MNILQYGCLGTRNYGDEVSAQIIRKIYRLKYKNVKFFVVGSSLNFLTLHHSDTEYCSVSNKNQMLEFCKKADLFVYGAGSIFNNKLMSGAKFILDNTSCPIISWGVGCGHVDNDSVGGEFINRAKAIYVRDSSIKHIKHLDKGHIHNIYDPMFLEGNISNKREFNSICITWGLTREKDELIEKVLDNLASMVNNSSKDWITIPAAWNPNNPNDDFDDDRLLHKRLATKCKIRQVTPGSFEHLSNIISRTNTLLTSRLHVGVVGYASECNVYWFGPGKNKVMAEYLNIPDRYIGNYNSFDLNKPASKFTTNKDIRDINKHLQEVM